MRKLFGALMAHALILAAACPSALAQQVPTFNLYGPIPPGANTIGSIANISGTISLPTGAATAANQSAINTTLTSIVTNTGASATAANQNSEINALGTPGDAAYAGSGASSIIAALKGIWSGSQNPMPLTAYYLRETVTPLAASATFTGTTRYGSFGGNGGRYAYFAAKFIADQAGTAFIEVTIDGNTWFTAETATFAAGGGSITLKTLMAENIRVRFVNGSTAQGKFYVADMLTAN